MPQPHHTAKQQGQQKTGLPAVLLDQDPSTAILSHSASDMMRPVEDDSPGDLDQPVERTPEKPAAQAGKAITPHIGDPHDAFKEPENTQPGMTAIRSIEQHSSSPTSDSADAIWVQREGQDQNSDGQHDSAAVAIGGVSDFSLKSKDAMAELEEPVHSSSRSVDQRTASAGTDSDRQPQPSHQQQLPSSSAQVPVHNATLGEEHGKATFSTAEEALSSSHIAGTQEPKQGDSPSAERASTGKDVAEARKKAQPVSSENAVEELAHSNPQPKHTVTSAARPQVRQAQGMEHSHAEHDSAMPRSAPSTSKSDSIQSNDNSAAPNAEGPTQAELLVLADAVNRLKAELAGCRQAAAIHEQEADVARQEAAQWHDREADARAQVPHHIFSLQLS